ncbi:MAG TPA: alpha-glycosidase, partial [Clostridiales bacterium]|nr:alpha-glycosidase [Clostridiales bacterium]
MLILYDPLDENCKSVTGAAEENEPIRFCIRISGAENCVLLVFKDGISEPTEYRAERSSDFFRFSVSLKRGLYFYRFVADGTVIGRGKGGLATAYSQEKYQLTVYKKEPFPTTFYGGIMYQIFPDRFSRAEGFGDASGRKMKKWGDTPDYLPDENGKITNDDFFGGNFEGIRRKIGYLKDLGVTSVYLNPVFKARSNHRYDTGDYFSVDPLLGSEEDFKRLVGSFHENGISVVLDGVFNHTGDDSVYFDKYGNYGSFGAYRSKSSRYYKWYSFTDYPDKYASWWGIETLPSVRKDCADFHEFIAGDGGALEKYLSFGIDG